MQAGAASEWFEQYSRLSPQDMQRFKARWLSAFESQTDKRICGHLRVLHRLQEFSARAGSTNVFGLLDFVLAEFCEQESQLGPSAVLSRLNSLAWLSRALGVTWPLQSPMLTKYRHKAPLESVRQQETWEFKAQ
eukprot:56696-Karenia_brevis.AAC.1